MNSEQRAQEIQKAIYKLTLLDAPGTIMFGLGLYGKFAARGDAFLPILNDPLVVNGMLAVGATIMTGCGYKIVQLSRERFRLNSAVQS